MSSWSWRFFVSLGGGLAAFAVLAVPLLVWQYRRFGRLSPRRIAAVVAISVYAVALVAYTLLPLPESATRCGRGPAPVQLVPLRFVTDMFAGNRDLAAALISRPALQVVANVALFVPFGLVVRRYARASVLVTAVAGLAASLLIELTQGTALWGAFACPWRIADVDDVLTNTAGAVLGAVLSPWLLAWLPQPQRLRAGRLRPAPVTTLRRLIGMVVDLLAFSVLAALLRGLLALPGRLGAAWTPDLVPGLAAAPALLAGVVVFWGPALRGRGASLGQRTVWLTPSWPRRPSAGRRLWRASVVGGAYALLTALADAAPAGSPERLLASAAPLLVLLALVSVPGTAGHRGLSGILSGATMIDARTNPSVGDAASQPPGASR